MVVRPRSTDHSVQNPPVFLGITWITGLLLGWFIATVLVDCLQKTSSWFLCGRKNMLSFLLPAFLPFLISALAVYFSAPGLLFAICATQAFLFGFYGFAVCFIFGQCSWLLRLLFMFTDICSAPILYLYWLRYLYAKSPLSWGTHICFSFCLLVICGIDLYVISPFAEHLFSI